MKLSHAVRWAALRTLGRSHALLPAKPGCRILLECTNSLMAGYVMRAFATVETLPGLRGWITEFPGREPAHEHQAEQLGLAWASRLRAVSTRWDLILLADHAPYRYAPSIPKLILPHGPGPSRTVRGGSYYYDPTRALWPDGTRVYDLMLDTSLAAADRALEWMPEYAGHIRAVGDLMADELAEVARDWDERGRNSARPVVAVMSTWGPHGLMQRHGHWLLPEIKALAADGVAEFVITMHSRLWDSAGSATDWARAVDGLASPLIRVLRPADSWIEPLARADVAVSDHTSLAGLFSILGRPMIPVVVPREILVDGTFFSWIVEHVPTVSTGAELRAALADLDRFRPVGAPIVVDHVGESRTRTAAAIRELIEPGRMRD